ncbi:MAG: PepSY domain-containing protein [Beijerinckiaceae bacterium]|nr:PepSY domain-containing protein [Beijerinckiaceae bacterium]
MSASRSIIILASLLGAVATAAASPRCKVPLESWQPREALEAKLKAEGWQVRRIKADDGCYKVEGTRQDGRRVKATFQPDTLTLIREKTRDD